jgi:small subunit ribosomal protein S9
MFKGTGVTAVGRRKTSVARVCLRPGTGVFTVNGKETAAYFGRPVLDMLLREPLVISEIGDKYDIIANVIGGGKSGQAGALRMGIGRALLKVDPDLRKKLKPAGILTRDSREVERKKYGLHKARRRPQYSKR